MFEMHLISGITDGWQVCESPPCQAKCKIRAENFQNVDMLKDMSVLQDPIGQFSHVTKFVDLTIQHRENDKSTFESDALD